MRNLIIASTRNFSTHYKLAQRNFASQHNIFFSNKKCLLLTTAHRRNFVTTQNKQQPITEEEIKAIDVRLKATVDKQQSVVSQKSSVNLEISHPAFRAEATVKFPVLEESEIWSVGWIQAMTESSFVLHHSEHGKSVWEVPNLDSGEQPMISDCFASYAMPWYTVTSHRLKTVCGPTEAETTVKVNMADHLSCNVCLHAPLHLPKLNSPTLNRVVRKDKFLTWLAMKCLSTEKIYPIRTIQWKTHMEFDYLPNEPAELRIKFLSPDDPEQPKILDDNVAIPECVLNGPTVTGSQKLVFYSSDEGVEPIVLVEPPGDYTSYEEETTPSQSSDSSDEGTTVTSAPKALSNQAAAGDAPEKADTGNSDARN